MERTIDLTAYRCPILLLKLKSVIKESSPGDKLHIFSSDPQSKNDVALFCEQKGFELKELASDARPFQFLVII